MNKKHSLKQHLFMVILFLCGNFFFVTAFFSKSTHKKIDSLTKQVSDAKKEKSFISGQAPKGNISLKEIEGQIKELRKQNDEYNQSLLGSSLKVFSAHEKVKVITENALNLNIDVEHSATKVDKNETIYALTFYSPFQRIVDLINKSNKDLGDIDIRSISMENQSGMLYTTLEFKL
ncbi:MAG: hypothetical protein NE330_07335 [Lentisphaeraceae bacterium]|nr:hypothetical protein [Lentisphaeraceae bacterium]